MQMKMKLGRSKNSEIFIFEFLNVSMTTSQLQPEFHCALAVVVSLFHLQLLPENMVNSMYIFLYYPRLTLILFEITPSVPHHHFQANISFPKINVLAIIWLQEFSLKFLPILDHSFTCIFNRRTLKNQLEVYLSISNRTPLAVAFFVEIM